MQFKPTNLQHFNTLNLSANANLAVLNNLDQIDELLKITQPLFFLGGGSNLVLQENISPYVVKVELKGKRLLKETSGSYLVESYAGENWHEFVKFCLQNSWYGLENLALIPGTVGAAPVQNIGAYGVELEQFIDTVTALNLVDKKLYNFSKDDCEFYYRDSLFKRSGIGKWLILKVIFRLPKVWQANISYPDLQKHDLLQSGLLTAANIFNAVCAVRQAKLPDPNYLPNAGSFFKNPIVSQKFLDNLLINHPKARWFAVGGQQFKLAAGWLIDNAGWRGKRLGPVGMHASQALVLVNYGGACANDVLGLAKAIKKDISQRFTVSLEQEPLTIS